MVTVGGGGEVVLQYLACVAEVPSAACLKPRLWCSPQSIHLGFQRVTCCSVKISRQASQFSWLNLSLLNMRFTGLVLADVPGIRTSRVTLMEGGMSGRELWAGCRGWGCSLWELKMALSSSSDSSHPCFLVTKPLLGLSLRWRAHYWQGILFYCWSAPRYPTLYPSSLPSFLLVCLSW